MEALIKEINMVDYRIEKLNQKIENLTNEIKSLTTKYDAYDIVAFLPSKIEQLKSYMAELETISNNKSQLEYILNSLEK